jgi:hypothetical protein
MRVITMKGFRKPNTPIFRIGSDLYKFKIQEQCTRWFRVVFMLYCQWN